MMALICMSLSSIDAEHFHGLTSRSLVKNLFKYSAYFLKDPLEPLFAFLLLSSESSSLHFKYKFFTRYMNCKYLPPICLFILLTSFQWAIVFNFVEVQFTNFFFYGLCLVSEKSLPNQHLQRFPILFSPKGLFF